MFFFACANNSKFELRSKSGANLVWVQEHKVSLFDHEDPTLLQCGSGRWLQLVKCNEPSFDAVLLHDDVVRFVQLNRRSFHGIKSEHCRDLISKFICRNISRCKQIEIFFVVPNKQLHEFSIGPIESPGALAKFQWPSDPERIKKRIQILGIDFD